MHDGYLTRELGRLLRGERERAGLTQRALAARAGVSQQCVSRFEKGRCAPTATVVERLFDGLGQQVRVDVEARDADLDRDIETAAGLGEDYRIGLLNDLRALLKHAAGLPYLLDGELAALLQGVPIRPNRFDLAIAQANLPLLGTWIRALPNCQRWNERWRDFGGCDVDPELSGPMRWMTPLGELRVRLLPTPPAPVPVMVDGREYPVRPLFDVERDDPHIARVLRRVGAQSTEGRVGPSTSSASTIV